jgi:hypothetical protein
MSPNDPTEPLKQIDPAAPPAIRGEKRVPGTDASLPVDNSAADEGGEGVTNPVAVDHRRQFTGNDDHRGTKGTAG